MAPHQNMYFLKSRKSQHACAKLRLTQTALPYSPVVLQIIRVKETGVIAELTVFTLSVVSNFHFSSFSAILLYLIVKLRTLLLHIALCFT